jgi:hypothetical protein
MPELIRGNRDGAHGTSSTYTICRLKAPRQQLVEEIEGEHLHPGYRVLHLRDAKGQVIDERPQNTPDGISFTNINHGQWPACCPAAKHATSASADMGQKRAAAVAGGRVVEYVHGHRDGKNRRNEHYTICRLGVPAETVAWEVREGLHPGYQVTYQGSHPEVTKTNSTQPVWHCGMACEVET